MKCLVFSDPASVDNAESCVGCAGRRLRGQDPSQHDAREAVRHRLHPRAGLQGEPGTNCRKIGLPGKLILSKGKGLREVMHILLKIVSENRFSGNTYFYTIAPRCCQRTTRGCSPPSIRLTWQACRQKTQGEYRVCRHHGVQGDQGGQPLHFVDSIFEFS